MKSSKKIISLVLASIMLLSSFIGFTPPQTVFANPTEVPPGEVTVRSVQAGQSLMRNGLGAITERTVDFIKYSKDGQDWPAYCIEPEKPGADINHSYKVESFKITENANVYGAIMNGYPFKSPSEYGLASDYELYYATKMAIWSLLDAPHFSFAEMKPNGAANQKVYDAYKKIYEAGKATTSMTGETLSATEVGAPITVSGNLIRTFSVSPSTIGYTLTIDGTALAGTQITDMSGATQTTFAAGDQFKVIIPLANIPDNTSGSFDVNIKAISGNGKAMIYEAKPLVNPQGTQNYGLVYEGELSGKVSVPYAKYNEEEKHPGKLRIVKKQAGTLIPLAGAEIKLTKADGGVVGIKYTDSNGECTFDNLPLGTYFVEEKTPPKGHMLDISSHKDIVLIAAKPEQTVTFENEETPKLDVYKKDAKTGLPVPYTTFEVSLDGGNEKYTITTDVGGVAKLGYAFDLKPGTYKIKEIAVPEPYWIDPNNCEQTIKLVAGHPNSVTFVNERKPGITIWKYIEGTPLLLDGTEFSVAKKGTGVIVWEGIVENGKHVLEDLSPGWYTITELASVHGYLITTKSKDIYLEAGAHVDIKFDNRERPSLEILKVDEKGNPLPNAIFSIKKTEGSFVLEKQTDENGRIYIPYDSKEIALEEAIYSIKEVQAPFGYIMDADCHRDVLLEWGQTKTLIFTNKQKPTLEILKIDSQTKAPIAGTKFRITLVEGETIIEEITNADGKIILTDLPAGIYKIEETVANDAYILHKEHKEIKLSGSDSKQVIFENTKKPELTILKIDSVTKLPIKDTKYKITKVEDETVIEKLTDSNGKIVLTGLDEAIYKIEETVANDDYILHATAKDIKLSAGDKKELIFENTKKPIIIITKTNALTQKGIPNTTFLVERESANGGLFPLGTFKTNANGQIIIPRVTPGWYVFTEKIPAQGMSLPSNPVTRKYLAPGGNSYTLGAAPEIPTNPTPTPNPPQSAGLVVTTGLDYNLGQEIVNWPLNSIVIIKENAVTGELLAGASFEVRRVTDDVSGSSGTVIGRYTTNHSGIIVLTGLEPGGFIIEEDSSPANFTLSENNAQQVWLKADGTSIVEKTFSNFPYGSLLITKVDGVTNKPLKNVRFRVVDGSGAVAGNTNGEYMTNENGEILIPNLPPNSYVVTEIESAPNYGVDTTPQTIKILADGKTYKVSFKNYPFGSLLISKVDGLTNQPLKNVRFKVVDSAGAAIGNSNGEYITNENGEILISNIQPQSLVVTELETLPDYSIDTTPQTIQIGTDGKTYKLSFKNYKHASLLISKVDGTNNQPLSNVLFKVVDSEGKAVGNENGEFTTNSSGEILIPNLKPSSYVVTELRSVPGFSLDDTPKTIKIGDDGKVYKLSFENFPDGTFILKKLDSKTKLPIKDVTFKLTDTNGKVIGTNGGLYTTDAQGTIHVNVPKMTIIYKEMSAPDEYIKNETASIDIEYGKTSTVEVYNEKKSGIQILKIDATTKKPLKSAFFSIYRINGELLGTYETNGDGIIILDKMEPGWIKISESKEPVGYIRDDTVRDVEIKSGEFHKIVFENKKIASLVVKKIDESSKAPLSSALFVVEKQSGELIGEFETDQDGTFTVPIEPSWVVIREKRAPLNYVLDETPKVVEIKTETPTVVTFTNRKVPTLTVTKEDFYSHLPIPETTFAVETVGGQKIGLYKTDMAGKFSISLEPNSYIVYEKISNPNYVLDSTPQMIEIKANQSATLLFENKPIPNLTVKKEDFYDHTPISDTTFVIETVGGQKIGDFKTDIAGKFSVALDPNSYIVYEKIANSKYVLDTTPQTIEIKAGKPVELVFLNKPVPNLTVIKQDFFSYAPIPETTFVIETVGGQKIGEYKTDIAGKFSVSLDPNSYIVYEKIANPSYILDTSPKTIEIKAGVPAELVFLNKPTPTLQVKKINSVTREPIENCRFLVTKQNGEKIGEFKTDKLGMFSLPNLEVGNYYLTEISNEGYVVDKEPKLIEIKTKNSPTIIEVENMPISSLLILKKILQPKNLLGFLRPCGQP